MPQTVIENPVINSPYLEPTKHFRFTDEGITNVIVSGRRVSSYFIPIPQPKQKTKQMTITESEWVGDRVEENTFINQIRDRVTIWRDNRWPGTTEVTRKLLRYWVSSEREKPLFFCQIEALETAIYLTEVAEKQGDSWILEQLKSANNEVNPGLWRIAFKMATGTGKTVVMAMILTWQTLNKIQNPRDSRFSDTFLIVTPGITIRDRLRVLYPNDVDNYYRQRDLVPPDMLERLGQARIHITNFHSFQLRETVSASKLTKTILSKGENGIFTETPDQMVRRVCRSFGNKKNIIIINDEAHHCYRPKARDPSEKLTGEESAIAKKQEDEARTWLSGIEAIAAKIGVRNVFDVSATPFFLKGSGYREGSLFPWVVSDFSLIDAIESGIVKVPRVPVSDNSMSGNEPTYRDLWYRIRDHLPKKGRKTEAVSGEPKLPPELEGAIHSLYSNYEQYFKLWEQDTIGRENGRTPPVFIVVCNNTNVSKLVFDYISGWEREIDGQTVVTAGNLPLFANDNGNGGWLSRPNTILVDSEQIESGTAMSSEFKRAAFREIEEFRNELRERFPGRDVSTIDDTEILREVMNTVGKPGKLGENIRCVVSVSMLTEGWDAQTVTHILGVRAFGTQLLCEQVVGRALRRQSYSVGDDGLFPPEYAEVYGVPFSFIPCSGSTKTPRAPTPTTRVRALEERIECEISFPRLAGYRYDIGSEQLSASFTKASQLALSTADIPTQTENAPIIGESSIHTLDDLKRHRPNEVAFQLAKRVYEQKFPDKKIEDQPWLFPQVLSITKQWLSECLYCKDNTFIQLLLLVGPADNAAEKIYHAIVKGNTSNPCVLPVMMPYDSIGSTRYVDFDTSKPVWPTSPQKCHISHVAADTTSWEQKMSQVLEEMEEVVHYVKNQSLGFTIPYTINGQEHQYNPDFIARIDDGHGPDDLLSLIVEVSGQQKLEKDVKVSTARELWVPAVNNHGGFGRWGFIEVTDPWDAAHAIRGYISSEGNNS